jgi:hypothetical protein
MSAIAGTMLLCREKRTNFTATFNHPLTLLTHEGNFPGVIINDWKLVRHRGREEGLCIAKERKWEELSKFKLFGISIKRLNKGCVRWETDGSSER